MRFIRLWGKELISSSSGNCFSLFTVSVAIPSLHLTQQAAPSSCNMPGIRLCFPLSSLKIVLFTGTGKNKMKIELFCPLFLRGAVAVLVHLDLKVALEGVYCVFVCVYLYFEGSSLFPALWCLPSSAYPLLFPPALLVYLFIYF